MSSGNLSADANHPETQLARTDSRARTEELVSHLIADQYDRPSLVSRIACEVASDIVLDIRKPGSDLNSVELARRFQTSRTPVRESLMLLEKEGLVEIPPRRRPIVRDLSMTEVRDIYRVRADLLGLVARDILARATRDEVRTLEPIIERMKLATNTNDMDAFFWANVDFQRRNTELAKNPTVKKIIDSLLLRTLRLRRIGLSQPGRMQRSLLDHDRLYRAYDDKDSDLAAALVRSNHFTGLRILENLHRIATEGGKSA